MLHWNHIDKNLKLIKEIRVNTIVMRSRTPTCELCHLFKLNDKFLLNVNTFPRDDTWICKVVTTHEVTDVWHPRYSASLKGKKGQFALHTLSYINNLLGYKRDGLLYVGSYKKKCQWSLRSSQNNLHVYNVGLSEVPQPHPLSGSFWGGSLMFNFK